MHLIVARRTRYKINGVTNIIYGLWGDAIIMRKLKYFNDTFLVQNVILLDILM